ncbi:hypothetical protein CORC01_02126 [Colletotrichum orchidophilum]|uniref:Avirulence Effector AvrLm4-7 domain-containing protein n=1 Tax=Colletotrichum orchidophilum TaxID=1209926 RepID=A0A1G4BLW9_9PEZI|nr:uncharacterized protein CORC01_02126 [Colletotrichum orchidophilum]OHF02431.1 hypothetical protein CORC01_02126 [Colletotrichum orchidophilum]
MKLPLKAVVLLVLASTATLVSAIKPWGKSPMNARERLHLWNQAACKQLRKSPFPRRWVSTSFTVTAIVDEDIESLCHRLWHNIKRSDGYCTTPTKPVCEDRGDKEIGEKVVYWSFNVFGFCPPSAVDSAWWESTGNIWGPSNCREGKYTNKNLPSLPFPEPERER